MEVSKMVETKNIQSEVELMNRSFGEGIVTEAIATEPPGTDAPGTNAPVSDSPLTEAPATGSPSTESPSTQAPSTESPSTNAPATDAPDEKDKIIEELRAKLAEKESLKTDAPTTEAPLALDIQDFVGDLDIEDVMNDPAEFNKLLNKIYQQAVTDTRKVLGEGVLRSIPDIVRSNIITMANLQKASDQFYADNEDLRPFKKVVAAVFEELASENPDKRFDVIMKDVAPEVRKRLELHKQATKKDVGDGNKPPRLPRKKGRSGRNQDKPNPSPLLNELEQMNKTLRR